MSEKSSYERFDIDAPIELCSTCSAEVLEGSENLAPPSRQERRILGWIGAPPRGRLTCQARIRGDVVIRPALSPIARLGCEPSDLPWSVGDEERS